MSPPRGLDVPPLLMLEVYAAGAFPMAESRDDPGFSLIEPRIRAILPLDGFHISRSLAKRLRQGRFTASADTDFAEVVAACANREATWINPALMRLYAGLHGAGHAHSIAVRQEGALVGGVFGVSVGAAFFAESMFSTRSDASKAALVWLVHRLRGQGFTLLDTQFLTPHLASLGGIEMPRDAFRKLLEPAVARDDVRFGPAGALPAAASLAPGAG
jgi:leucyl/phenylalanyl-tRNA--protein transferase